MKIAKTITLMLIMFNCIVLNAAKEPDAVWRSPTVVRKKKEQKIFVAIKNNRSEDLATLFQSIPHEDYWKTLLNYSFDNLTPLQAAVSMKPINVDVVRALLDQGADPNIGIQINMKDRTYNSINYYEGWTSCHLAVRHNASYEILQLLHEHHGDFLQEDNGGWTPLALAIHHKRGKAKQFFNKIGLWQPKAVNKNPDTGDEDISDDKDDTSSEEYFSSEAGIPLLEQAHHHEPDPNFIYTFTHILVILGVLYYGIYQ